MDKHRRDFLRFLGASALVMISGYGRTAPLTPALKQTLIPNDPDEVNLIRGLSYEILIAWGDPLNDRATFGYNNDFIALQAIDTETLLMWVNHEYPVPWLMGGTARTQSIIDAERRATGGSYFKVRKLHDRWTVAMNDPSNGVIRADTLIPFANDTVIVGKQHAMGTIANCAGGQTPWGSFLTCEENTEMFYGEREPDGSLSPSELGWEMFYPVPPEHYGWVVEINPHEGTAQKLVKLGRFAHESATCIATKNNNVVVYTADDKEGEHLYKFVGHTGKRLEDGTLFVANMEQGRWLALNRDAHPALHKAFTSDTDLLINTRQAAKLVGATPLNRPEDIAIHPLTGDVYVALTGSRKNDDPFGSIVRISEDKNDHNSLTFKSSTQYLGGLELGFACPDNLVFDSAGNLWVCTDISGSSINKPPYERFGNNGIFVIPIQGPSAGRAIQIASAPIDAEFTGLCFSPDEKTLFVSVQHPGEQTKNPAQPTSRWPHGQGPKPAVIAIGGQALQNGVTGLVNRL